MSQSYIIELRIVMVKVQQVTIRPGGSNSWLWRLHTTIKKFELLTKIVCGSQGTQRGSLKKKNIKGRHYIVRNDLQRTNYECNPLQWGQGNGKSQETGKQTQVSYKAFCDQSTSLKGILNDGICINNTLQYNSNAIFIAAKSNRIHETIIYRQIWA